MRLLRRVLSHKFTVAAIFELALWLALPYVGIGMAYAFTHPEYLGQREKQLRNVLPPGVDGELVAIGESALGWPVIMLLPADLCAPYPTS
jgi:hypothetical protein